MDRFREALADREIGGLPLSIATSLAIESACGLLPESEGEPPIHSAKELWINMRTLYRNLMGSLQKEAKVGALPEPLREALLTEMTVIQSTIDKVAHGDCKVVFYACTYKDVVRKFPNALLRGVTTENQKVNQALEEATLKTFFSGPDTHDVRSFDSELKTHSKETLILTHLPVDLLSRYNFDKLQLLESHTGKIKPPAQWNTKLTGGKDLPRIPFNRFTMQVFGDSNNHFSQQPIKIRQVILDLAEKDSWTAVTTEAKIKYSINSIWDPRTKAFFLAMF